MQKRDLRTIPSHTNPHCQDAVQLAREHRREARAFTAWNASLGQVDELACELLIVLFVLLERQAALICEIYQKYFRKSRNIPETHAVEYFWFIS
jgi:hypothetical protein